MNNINIKLTGKVIITGEIVAETGMHIGGTKSTKQIGGADNNVIKSANGIPYIPGSSLKGKLRSILAKKEGSIEISKDKIDKEISELNKESKKFPNKKEVNDKKVEMLTDAHTDDQTDFMYPIFGGPGDKAEEIRGRLLVRDAKGKAKKVQEKKNRYRLVWESDELQNAKMEFDLTDIKTENTIDRRSGTSTGGLRQIERVPEGATFGMELIYDEYDDGDNEKYLKKIQLAMQLLQKDYLGGSGSRGYGKISFKISDIEYYKISDDDMLVKLEAGKYSEIFNEFTNSEKQEK